MRRWVMAPSWLSIACCPHACPVIKTSSCCSIRCIPSASCHRQSFSRIRSMGATESRPLNKALDCNRRIAFFQRRSETYGAAGNKSSCWRSIKISSKTASGSLILPISCCHCWYSSSVTCNDGATGFSFSSCWLTSIERKFDLSCTLSSHRRISMRSYSASRLLSASGSSLDAATSRRIGIFSS
ncbi:hypothetical protein D3C72_1165540 [compost metagenome]